MSESEGLVAVAATDDTAAILRALRADLAAQYAVSPAAYRAGLARELKDTIARLDALPNKSEVSAADEIAARRAARRSGSAAQARS